MNTRDKIYNMPFAEAYPYLLAKLDRKGHTKAELDRVIRWLTGYSPHKLTATLKTHRTTLEAFFTQAPQPHPARKLITGVVCGERVEDIEDPIWQEIRYLDKLVDELARGKAMDKVLRREITACPKLRVAGAEQSKLPEIGKSQPTACPETRLAPRGGLCRGGGSRAG